jgi:hypothetical protein
MKNVVRLGRLGMNIKMATKIPVLLALFFMSGSCNQDRSSGSKLNYQSYIGKPVGALLKDLPITYKEYRYLHEPPCVIQGCIFYFSNGKKMVVYITGQELQYLERFSKECTWDFEAFKKEKITDVELINQNQSPKRVLFQVSP